MSDEMKKKEEAVFAQELNDEELKAATGGACIGGGPVACVLTDILDVMGISLVSYDCTGTYKRNIYYGGFPNCAATVESGSWCESNDACSKVAILYEGIKGCWFSDCHKAWK